MSVLNAGSIVVAACRLKAESDAVSVQGLVEHFAQTLGPVVAVRLTKKIDMLELKMV